MALKFGPQWLRDLGDVGASGNPQSPTTPPTCSVKFKLADYRYGREEMLALFNESSPPPDQVRKHLTIFSKEIQKPMTLTQLTEDEQRLISQGFNSTLVLRQAGRGSAPPLRVISRGGATVDRGRGRGRGRGEGFSRTLENGDIGYTRSAQEGWEQVQGRKIERSFSREEELGPVKREFTRSASDNWRDKKQEKEDDEDGGSSSWRNSRWGTTSVRQSWRDAPRENGGYENDRRPNLSRRGYDDLRRPRRPSESQDNDEVPEWVEDDIEDDPGTFDSKGVFVSTKENKGKDEEQIPNGTEKTNSTPSDPSKRSERTSPTEPNKTSHKPHNSLSSNRESPKQSKPGYNRSDSLKGRPDSTEVPSVPSQLKCSKKGDGDSGFAFPTKEEVNGTTAPPGQFSPNGEPENIPSNRQEETTPPLRQALHVNDMSESDTFSLVDKSLMNLVTEMIADADSKLEEPVDVAEHALPLSHENAHKWFYKDPQGEVQGPFNNDDMAQWFSAGYFTMSLIVKRGCDDSFKQLGELIKRYGRVPFLPGPPLPPLVTSNTGLEMISTVPPLISPMMTGPLPTLVGGVLPGVQDPLMYQQLLLQQEYLKQTFLFRQLQMQNLQSLQEQESFKGLTLEQQQHLAMQMTMQSNPMTMQHIQQLQQQQLLTQQRQQQQTHSEQQRISPPTVPLEMSNPGLSIPSSIPLSVGDSVKSNSRPPLSTTATMSTGEDASSVWGRQNSVPKGGEWSQPSSLWDVTPGSENVSPAYQAQIEKLKKEREETRLKEERLRQEALEKKQAELKRQQAELEKQREQMRKDKEDLERQKQLELQKLEEARRQEEDRLRHIEEEQLRRQLEEQKKQELERQRQEEEEERRKAELMKQAEGRKAELMRQAEEEKRKEKELKKQEERKRKEESKKNNIEEQKRHMEDLRKREEERRLHEEMLREQEQERKEEERMLKEGTERDRLGEQSERDRQREDAEKEYVEAERRQQAELLKQQEALRRLKQAQTEQLANIQLPAASNWGAHQSNQGRPVNSKSLMEIQAEEARRERDSERERQAQMQQIQEEATVISQLNQQKSWATHTSRNVPKGPSLLDIQQQEQQEQEISKKSNKSNQSKMSLNTASTWSNPLSSQHIWSAQSWDSGLSGTGSIWETPAAITRTGSGSKSGDFPALRNPAQSGGNKNAAKVIKTKNSKIKKEEETVQKLFQTNQKQDSFSDWVSQRVAQFSAPIDVPTFVTFIVEVDNPEDVKDYMKTYLGDTKEIRDFSRQFIEKRSKFRNQARLEKQQEEDSIWGPAPAVNPYVPTRGGGNGSNATSNVDSNEGGSAKAKKKSKKQKMQRLDMSSLGFTVHSDPDRKNAAGEFESVQ